MKFEASHHSRGGRALLLDQHVKAGQCISYSVIWEARKRPPVHETGDREGPWLDYVWDTLNDLNWPNVTIRDPRSKTPHGAQTPGASRNTLEVHRIGPAPEGR